MTQHIKRVDFAYDENFEFNMHSVSAFYELQNNTLFNEIDQCKHMLQLMKYCWKSLFFLPVLTFFLKKSAVSPLFWCTASQNYVASHNKRYNKDYAIIQTKLARKQYEQTTLLLASKYVTQFNIQHVILKLVICTWRKYLQFQFVIRTLIVPFEMTRHKI